MAETQSKKKPSARLFNSAAAMALASTAPNSAMAGLNASILATNSTVLYVRFLIDNCKLSTDVWLANVEYASVKKEKEKSGRSKVVDVLPEGFSSVSRFA